jgi:fluoride ion exporter CrcB/FEX
MTAARRMSLVALGGACGGVARMFATVLVPAAADADATHWEPIALLAVNLSGSLLAGFLRGLLEREQHAVAARGEAARGEADGEADGEAARETLRDSDRAATNATGDAIDAFLLVGFCGGFTSYSGFIAAAVADAAWIAVATVVLCPLAALLGMRLSGGYPARPAGTLPGTTR